MSFVHLHNHSHYSLLNALPKIKELVGRAKSLEMPSLALTDNGNLYGAIDFYKTCTKEDIKPIIGVDFYVARRTRNDREPGIDNRRFRLVLLAKNNEGYKSLIKLVTRSNLEGFYYKPRIDHELMAEHNKGLVCIIPSFSGETSALLKLGDIDGAKAKVAQYKEIYGEDDTYLEITHHPEINGHDELQEKIVGLSKTTNTPTVATHDTYYLDTDDRAARDTLISVAGSAGFAEKGGLTKDEEDFSFKSPQKMEKFFADLPDAIENTGKIADKCNVKLELGEAIFPNFEIPEGSTYDKELEKLAYKGLKPRDMEKTQEVEERIQYELGIIKDKDYAPYFLIVADLLRFARENDIYYNTRGSAAGSLVSYLCGITNSDPLFFRLPFERFLNPDRPSAPDIDMDLADDRRDEVIAYAKQKYGEKNVAQIGTFGTMMARGAVRDTARALGYDYSAGDRIAKLIPLGAQGFPMTIDRAFTEEPELKRMYDTDEEVRNIIDMAKKIEGCARHISVHAAGVVISPIPLDEIVPVQMDPKGEGKLITQYDMYSVADEYGGVGLVKFDFLGLKNLSVLADAVHRVKKILKIDVDIDNLPIDDEKTFSMLSEGRTMGVFQLAGSGMTRYLKDLKPTNVHDINAMVALYRPGPMEFIPEFIKRKHNPKAIDYPHDSLEKDLEQSFGLLIYQEDVMLTAIKLANYSWLEADKFRKAMGKKIPALMAEQEERFKSGCVGNGIGKKMAAELWRRITPFAAYAFNKSHSVSYGNLAYQTAYMKANFPVIYMAALLTADSGDVDKIAEGIAEAKRFDIEVLAPDVNESLGDFSVVFDSPSNDSDKGGEKPEDIRFGLYSIKNFGKGIADAIIEERKENGNYESLSDFFERIKDKNLNKKSVEALIKCGAMDAFGERGTMLANLDGLLSYSRAANSQPEGQDSLFGLMEDQTSVPELTLEPSEPATNEERLVWEKELLGLYVSGHPLDKFRDKIEGHEWDIKRAKEELNAGYTTVLMGVIEESKPIQTKRGARMAFMRLADFSGSIEVVVFPEVYQKHRALVESEGCIAVRGVMSDRGGDVSLLAENMKALS